MLKLIESSRLLSSKTLKADNNENVRCSGSRSDKMFKNLYKLKTSKTHSSSKN